MATQSSPLLTSPYYAQATRNGNSSPSQFTEQEHISRAFPPTPQHQSKLQYGPMAHVKTPESEMLIPAFGGEVQPGLFKNPEGRRFANPAPLGLSAFALTTFVLSLINVHARSLTVPNITVGLAFGYGGLVQLLAGMWEMAIGNTFGATALSSYGGFWISFGIILTPGGFGIIDAYIAAGEDPNQALASYLFGWTIFTFFMLLCTLRSTLAFFMLFLTLDATFLTLACAYQNDTLVTVKGAPTYIPQAALQTAGGAFGLAAAFLAWYNALAGIIDDSNRSVLALHAICRVLIELAVVSS